MDETPPFDKTVVRFRGLLRAQGHPEQIAWAFREDFYSVGGSSHRVVWPLPPDNEAHVAHVFAAAQGRGLVELEALFPVGDTSVVTVLAPGPDEIQGWSQGLKLTIRLPFVQARPVTLGLAWLLHRLRPAYRRFQQRESFVPCRTTLRPRRARS